MKIVTLIELMCSGQSHFLDVLHHRMSASEDALFCGELLTSLSLALPKYNPHIRSQSIGSLDGDTIHSIMDGSYKSLVPQ